VLQSAPEEGQTASLGAVRVIDSMGTKVDARSRQSFTVGNRVFYKELEEGVYKIIDVNSVLLA